MRIVHFMKKSRFACQKVKIFWFMVKMKDALLNPLSHHDIETPIYKAELKAIMAVLKQLESVRLEELSKTRNKDFILRLEKPDKDFFAIEFKTRDSIMLIKEASGTSRLLHCCKCEQVFMKYATAPEYLKMTFWMICIFSRDSTFSHSGMP